MNYAALIQHRKSYREFTDAPVSASVIDQLRAFEEKGMHRLLPQLKTELHIYGTDAREALEGIAGYNQFLVGAPQYLVLLSEAHPQAYLNAGYILQDLILKLEDLGLNSCWLTFTDSNAVKDVLGIDSRLEVAAIAAFGYGKKTTKRMRLNIRTMSDVDIHAKYRYMEPKRSVQELSYVETWANRYNLERYIGFYDDMLWESLFAASLAPSYLNRQAYNFLLHDGCVSLIAQPDGYNTEIDGDLSLGAVMLHFAAVAEGWTGPFRWNLEADPHGLQIPEGYRLVAGASL